MELDRKFYIIIVFLIIIIPKNLFSNEKDSINTQVVMELLENIVSLDSNKLKNNFKFPLYDKTLLEILQDDVKVVPDIITLEIFMNNYNILFPKRFVDLFKKILIENKITNENLYNIEFEDLDENEKECYIRVDFSRIKDKTIALSFGTNYNYKNTFNLEDDYFCDEFTYFYFFELINGVLVFKEFHIAG